jgi:hypothetical protein
MKNDGEARLVRFATPRRSRKRFEPAKHAAWQARVGGKRPVRWVDEFLGRDRRARRN